MPSPFPGMDPYLENPALWPNVHGRLIAAIADALSPLYPSNLSMPLPQVPIPLRKGDREPVIDLQTILSQIYKRSGYAFSIDYGQPPKPSWDSATLQWISNVIEARD